MKKAIGLIFLAFLIALAFYNGYKKTEEENKKEQYLSAKEYIDAVTLDVGSKAPNFKVTDLHTEKAVKLSDFNDKPILLTFFASWCGVCKEDIPLFNEMKKEYGDKLTIVAVNYTQSERTPADVTKYVEEYEMKMPVLLDPNSKAVGAYKVISLPTTYFISREGKIEDKSFGAFTKKQLREKINQLLSNNA